MALRAERPKPVDWKEEARKALLEEERECTRKLRMSCQKRMLMLFFYEESYPWRERQKDKGRWLDKSMKRHSTTYGVPWGPTMWR